MSMRPSTRLVVLNSKKLISVVAAAAYSLRRLYASYTGAAIRVRRSSDNAEIDIGFIGEHLDLFALLVFVGSGSGFVTTWYDQSGNGRNATQATVGSQPQIVTNGAIETQNGRPALRFDGTRQMNTPSFLLGNTVVAVARRSATSQPVLQGLSVGSSDRGLWGINSGGSNFTTHINYGINGGPLSEASAIGFPLNELQIVTQTVAKGQVATTSSVWQLGGGSSGYTLLNGWFAEMIAFLPVLSTTNRQTLERNQGSYFNISVNI